MSKTIPTKPTVLLTRRWPAAVEEQLAQRFELITNPKDVPMSASLLTDALQQADAVCPTVTDTFAADAFSQPVRCQILGNFGVGYNHIPLAAAKSCGVTVTNTPDVLTDCTADLTLMLLLMVARRASEGERELRAGQWQGWRPTHLMGTQVSGKTLGIVGMGRIGLAVARRAQQGFGMRIVYHNRSPVTKQALGGVDAKYFAELDELLPHCDFLSLHCPASPTTHHLLNADRFSKLRSGTMLLNTARGDVVDEDALLQALEDGQLGGAGLDVYQGEPKLNPRFVERQDVVLLPHLGSATVETRTAMGMRVAENLKAFFNAQPVPDAL